MTNVSATLCKFHAVEHLAGALIQASEADPDAFLFAILIAGRRLGIVAKT